MLQHSFVLCFIFIPFNAIRFVSFFLLFNHLSLCPFSCAWAEVGLTSLLWLNGDTLCVLLYIQPCWINYYFLDVKPVFIFRIWRLDHLLQLIGCRSLEKQPLGGESGRYSCLWDLQQQSWIRTHFLKLFKMAWELCASLLSPIIRSTGDNVGRLELISGGLCQPSRSELFQRLTKCQSGEVSLPVRTLPYRDIIVYQRHARAG